MSFFCQVFDRTKDPAGDDVALDLGKPDLDLVKPRSIGGCKMDPHVGMTFDKLPDSRVAMGREIVCNVNLLTLGKAGHDLLQESDKLRTGVDEGWFGRFLAAKIEFSYGAGQTVSLLALRLQWFESTPTQNFADKSLISSHLAMIKRLKIDKIL